MFKVIDLNDTGKTKKLLTECAENHGVILCNHPEKIADKCLSYNIPLVTAYHYKDFKKVRANYVYVDELEKFVNSIIPNLSGYSMTIEK